MRSCEIDIIHLGTFINGAFLQKLYLYNKAHGIFTFLSASTLAIFMDQFWNQGYLWTPHDYQNIKLSNFEKIKKKIEKFPSLNASSNPKGERGPPEAAL